MTEIVHIAAQPVTIGDQLLRQRCAWCGATLLDYDLTRIAVPAGQDPTPSTWPTGELIAVDGPWSTVVDHADGDPLPDTSCGRLAPEVTR